MPDLTLPDDELGMLVQNDWNAARDTRLNQLEARMFSYYKMFRAYRDDVQGGGLDGNQPGPFGWSKLTVRVCYTTVMEEMARLAVEVPQLGIKADNPESEPYAAAKELELRWLVERGGWNPEFKAALRDSLIYGMNPVKTIWDDALGGPRMFSIWWWDFYLSPEADSFRNAEYLVYRSWHTPAAMDRMEAMRDKKGRRIFRNLDNINGIVGPGREADDSYWSMIRTVQGIGPQATNSPQYWPMTPVTELWYKDGTVITVSGGAYSTVIATRAACPFEHVVRGEVDSRKHHCFLDDTGQAFRPFAPICPNPDNGSPYGISEVEVVADPQRELSTIRNQYTDQFTAALNSPLGINRELANPVEVTAAFKTPGGQFAVDGDPNAAVHRFSPPDLGREMQEYHTMVMSDVDRVTGLRSNAEGRPESPGMVNESPLGFAMRIGEINKRRQLQIGHVMDGAIQVAKHFDWLNRNVNFGNPQVVRIPDGYDLTPESAGIREMGQGKWAKVNAAVNSEGRKYRITIDTTSLIPSYKGQKAMELTGFVQTISGVDELKQLADWPEIMRNLAEAFDVDPSEVMLSPEEVDQNQQQDGQQQGTQNDQQQLPQGDQQPPQAPQQAPAGLPAPAQPAGLLAPGEPGGPPMPPGGMLGAHPDGSGYSLLPHGQPELIGPAPGGAAPTGVPAAPPGTPPDVQAAPPGAPGPPDQTAMMPPDQGAPPPDQQPPPDEQL